MCPQKNNLMKQNLVLVFKNLVLNLAHRIKNDSEMAYTECGSVNYFLYGRQISRQSINIRWGNEWEKLLNEFSLYCGVEPHYNGIKEILGHQVDSLRLICNNLDYEEQKTNAGLDSEKAPATLKKISEIKNNLTETELKDLIENKLCVQVRGCIFHTTVWEEKDADTMKPYYKKYKDAGLHVKTMKEYFESLSVPMTREQFYEIAREAGTILST